MHHFLLASSLLAIAASAQDTRPAASAPQAGLTIRDVGFRTPESVLWDPESDVYLVSNVHGAPTASDDNGFVARVTPDGKVEDLKWIDGSTADVTLHAPKGMALAGELLCIADIDCVRLFDRKTGKPRGEVAIPGATFVNDVAVGAGAEDRLLVSDSGFKPDFTPSGTAALWVVDLGKRTAARFEDATRLPPGGPGLPNGVLTAAGTWYWVNWDRGELIASVAAGAVRVTMTRLPKAQLDGLVRLGDGTFLVSSWEGACVYRVAGQGADAKVTTVARGLAAPADVGFDGKRQRLLIPLFQDDKVVLHPLAAADAAGR